MFTRRHFSCKNLLFNSQNFQLCQSFLGEYVIRSGTLIMVCMLEKKNLIYVNRGVLQFAANQVLHTGSKEMAGSGRGIRALKKVVHNLSGART